MFCVMGHKKRLMIDTFMFLRTKKNMLSHENTRIVIGFVR